MGATPVHAGFLNQAYECQASLDDILKPACYAVQAPKLDAELKEQIRKKGKDPQFGQ